MEKQDHRGSNLHSFFFGLIVGVAVTLLFTTKKGRQVLKALTEQGMDKVSQWEEVLRDHTSDTEDDEFVEEEVDEDYIKEQPQQEQEERKEAQGANQEEPVKEVQKEEKKNGEHKKTSTIRRRFFRRVPKH